MKCETCGHDNVSGARFCAACGGVLPVQSESQENKMIGQVIGGRYRVTGVLGEGGMGVVYVGEQQMGSTLRKVAIKTLHPHLSQDPSVLARFHRECGTVAQLEHPNTIKVYDFGAMADGTLYIAMEFVAGRPLNRFIEQGALGADRVVHIMRQICGALDEAHKLGIIHRDLKPENVILTDRAGETDFVKVLDFGIAARTESADAQKEQKLTQQGMVLGTPPYMSPEQFTGKPLDVRSDVYSLGVMAYEMLAGKLPFEADTPWQWATQHMTAQPAPLEVAAPNMSIPEAMRHAIMRALSKDREARQQSAREFFTELSGGDRVTVERTANVAQSTGTAAMAAAPQFAATAAAPRVPTAVAPVYGAPPAVAANVVPAAPAQRARSGGNKGLVIALGAVGAILLLAIAVVAMRSLRPKDEDAQLTVSPFTSASGATTIAPTIEPDPVPNAGTAADPQPAAADPSPAEPGAAKPKPGPGKDPGSKPAPAGEACEACLSAARSGNIQGAAASYGRCSDAGKKAACSAAARGAAPGAAKRAAFNGNCAQAKGIISAASAMGIGGPAMNNALAGTSCR
jgi:serine/threonine-protein kinase